MQTEHKIGLTLVQKPRVDCGVQSTARAQHHPRVYEFYVGPEHPASNLYSAEHTREASPNDPTA